MQPGVYAQEKAVKQEEKLIGQLEKFELDDRLIEVFRDQVHMLLESKLNRQTLSKTLFITNIVFMYCALRLRAPPNSELCKRCFANSQIGLRYDVRTMVYPVKMLSAAASIWFEIWGLWIRVQKILIFPGKLTKNFDFSRQFDKRF